MREHSLQLYGHATTEVVSENSRNRHPFLSVPFSSSVAASFCPSSARVCPPILLSFPEFSSRRHLAFRLF